MYNMSTRLSREELKEDLCHILHTMWGIHPRSPFYNNVRNSKAVKRNLITGFVTFPITSTDDDIKECCSASDAEARKVIILLCYFYYLQH